MDRVTGSTTPRGRCAVGDGPPLPLPRGARDALAAFLYARTLPLAPGFAADVPVVEGGRRYTVGLAAQRVERNRGAGPAHRGAETDAAHDGLRGAADEPLGHALHRATDARRVPLLILVDAGFGSFRLELARYDAR